MKQILEPLARIPGVRSAALITPDGVPICTHHAHPQSKAAPGSARQGDASEPIEAEDTDAADDGEALAALAASWVSDVARAAAPLSWSEPARLVLRAARGSLVIVQAPGALLLVVLEGGTSSEDLRLPMEIVVSRLQRHLRSLRDESVAGSSSTAPVANPTMAPSSARPPASVLPAPAISRAGQRITAPGEYESHRTGSTPASHPTSSGDRE
jgi:predicted regulator of Ras-like GTPase activity (Roadblock/LC7/MglB family)